MNQASMSTFKNLLFLRTSPSVSCQCLTPSMASIGKCPLWFQLTVHSQTWIVASTVSTQLDPVCFVFCSVCKFVCWSVLVLPHQSPDWSSWARGASKPSQASGSRFLSAHTLIHTAREVLVRSHEPDSDSPLSLFDGPETGPAVNIISPSLSLRISWGQETGADFFPLLLLLFSPNHRQQQWLPGDECFCLCGTAVASGKTSSDEITLGGYAVWIFAFWHSNYQLHVVFPSPSSDLFLVRIRICLNRYRNTNAKC